MTAHLFIPRKLGPHELTNCARELARRLADFSPEYVLYLEQGGRRVGQIIADDLGLPLSGIAINYPLSPLWNKSSSGVRFLCWPIKELIYRLGDPSLAREIRLCAEVQRVALVDDSASTGRSLALALSVLERIGIGRQQICTGVIRCGDKARQLVDHYLFTEKVLFVGH